MRKYFICCSIIFVCLSVLHYFSQRPLWLDEDFVYQNIVNLDYGQLFGPLKPTQSFPRVHLAIVKWIGSHFSNHDLSLRFLSLVFMVASYFVWKKLYKSTIKTERGLQLLLLLFSWCSSYWMVYYAAELKPYSMDVLGVGLFALFFLYQRRFEQKPPTKALYVLSALIPFLLFFSYGCIFVFWIACYNFLRLAWGNKKLWPVFVLNSLMALICFVAFYYTDIQHSITAAGVNYWQSYFLCTESIGCFFETFGEGIKRFSVFWWGTQKIFRRAAVIFIPLFLYGLYRFGWLALKRDHFRILNIEALSCVLFAEFFVLGILQKYPFTGQRITLFFAPFVFYLVIKSLYEARRIKFLGNILFVYYIGYCILSFGISVWGYVHLYL